MAREWVVPLNENVIQSICNRICFIHETTQLQNTTTIPLLIEEINHMFMRLNVICELQQRWKDIEHHNKFRQNDPNRLFYRKYVNLMHTIHVPSPFIAMKKVEIPTIGTVAVLTDSLTKRIKIMETMYKLGSVQIYNIHQANYDLYIQSKYIGKTEIDNTTIDLDTFLMNEIEQVNIFHQHIITIWQVQIAKSIQKLDNHI